MLTFKNGLPPFKSPSSTTKLEPLNSPLKNSWALLWVNEVKPKGVVLNPNQLWVIFKPIESAIVEPYSAKYFCPVLEVTGRNW